MIKLFNTYFQTQQIFLCLLFMLPLLHAHANKESDSLQGNNYALYSQNSKGLSFELSCQEFESCRTNAIKVLDIEGDGDLDMIWANMAFYNSQIMINDGTGNFTASEQVLTQQGHGIDLGDLDQDGDIDIVIPAAGWTFRDTLYSKPTKLYFNDGTGVFNKKAASLPDSLLSGNAVHIVDIDGDQDLDIHIIYYQNTDKIYLNNGEGIFDKVIDSFPENCTFGDFDQNGMDDLFIWESGKGYDIRLNDGQGHFISHQQIPDTCIERIFTFSGDIEPDGDIDIIITSGNRNKPYATTIMLNDGFGNFIKSEQNLDSVSIGRAALGDLNMDGLPEIIVTNVGNPTQIWMNEGNGSFYNSNLFLQANGAIQPPVVADLDSDGDNDLIIPNFFGGPNEIWINKIK